MSKSINVENEVETVETKVIETSSKEEGETKKKIVLTPKKLIKIAVGIGAAVAGIAFAKSVDKRQTELESDINDLSVKTAENTLRLSMLENTNTSTEELEDVELEDVELEEF